MAKPRKQRDKTATASSVETMVTALKFCALASRGIGPPYQSHVKISGGRAISFDGTLAAGTMIQADSDACPHLAQLIASLSKCGDQVSITQLDPARLSVRSERLRAVVECIDPATIPEVQPDAAAVAVDNRMVKALALAGQLASDVSQEVVTASVQLTSLYAFGTNRHVMYRAEHGIELPGSLTIPKMAIKALMTSGKDLSHLGASKNSITFWFSDGSWLRSQLYAEGWPEAQAKQIFEAVSKPTPFPDKFFEALEAIKPFCKESNCYMGNGGIRSHLDESQGAKYEVSDLPENRIYNPEYLLALEDIADCVDFYSDDKKVYFTGDALSGILLGKQI